jgi:hypothetical protein
VVRKSRSELLSSGHGWGHGFSSGVRDGLERQTRDVPEDRVVGDQGDAETDGGRGDPSVGVVLTLAQGVPGSLASGSQLRVGEYELRAAVDGLHSLDLRLELEHRLLPQPRRSAL